MPFARQTELLAREERRHELELHAVADILGIETVDLVHFRQREILLTLLGWTDQTTHRVARLQAEKLDLRRRYVDIVGRIEVVVIGRPEEPVSVGHDFEDTFALDFTDEIVFGNYLRPFFTDAGCRFRYGRLCDDTRFDNRCFRLLGAFRFAPSAFGYGCSRFGRLLDNRLSGSRNLRFDRNFGGFGRRPALDLYTRHPGTPPATLRLLCRNRLRHRIVVLLCTKGDRLDLLEQLPFL